MKSLILIACAFAFCANCARADDAKPVSPGVSAAADVPTDIRRVTLIVADMENSLQLYRDVLGLKVNYDTVVETSGVALPAGEPGAKTRLVLLNGKDPWIGWIGLMEWLEPPLAKPAEPRTRLGIGDHVIIANTDDARARCEMAKAVPNVRFTAEARLQTYPGRNGAPDIRVMGCNFFDPDGNLIELNQILKPGEE